METWYRDNCPKCKSPNWVDDGDTNDQTVPDIDGIECWNCDFVWILCEEWEEETDAYVVERGRKTQMIHLNYQSVDEPIILKFPEEQVQVVEEKISFVWGDDWKGMYLDGVLVCQDHDLDAYRVLEMLGLQYESIQVDQIWLDERGQLPNKLKLVRRAKED